MSKAIGGLNKNQDMIQARKQCAYCKKEFKPQESKIMADDKFYHTGCCNKMLYNHDDFVNNLEGKEK